MKTFMLRALELAYENVAKSNGGPFGCVIVKDGEVIAEGANQVTASNDPTAHAEVVAIRKACTALESFQLTGCDLYTSCEPCPMCLGAIYWARPDRVFFAASRKEAAAIGFDDEAIYEEIALDFNQRKIPFVHLQPATEKNPMSAWQESSARIEY